MGYFLAPAGTLQDPWDIDDWMAELPNNPAMLFPDNKRGRAMQRGDRVIRYAAGSPRVFGSGRFFASQEVVSRQTEPHEDSRWPWRREVRLRLAQPFLSQAPTLEDIGVDPKSVRRQPYINLTPEQGQRAEELLLR